MLWAPSSLKIFFYWFLRSLHHTLLFYFGIIFCKSNGHAAATWIRLQHTSRHHHQLLPWQYCTSAPLSCLFLHSTSTHQLVCMSLLWANSCMVYYLPIQTMFSWNISFAFGTTYISTLSHERVKQCFLVCNSKKTICKANRSEQVVNVFDYACKLHLQMFLSFLKCTRKQSFCACGWAWY